MTSVRVCPGCGQQNSAVDVFCRKCMMDISTVAPSVMDEVIPASEPQAQPQCSQSEGVTKVVNTQTTSQTVDMCSLELVSDPNVMLHLQDGQTIGRGDQADIRVVNVPDVDAISRVHAKFFTRNGQWYIQYLGKTNFIKVDGQIYGDTNTEVALYEGSIVVLSLTPFTFHIVD